MTDQRTEAEAFSNPQLTVSQLIEKLLKIRDEVGDYGVVYPDGDPVVMCVVSEVEISKDHPEVVIS